MARLDDIDVHFGGALIYATACMLNGARTRKHGYPDSFPPTSSHVARLRGPIVDPMFRGRTGIAPIPPGGWLPVAVARRHCADGPAADAPGPAWETR